MGNSPDAVLCCQVVVPVLVYVGANKGNLAPALSFKSCNHRLHRTAGRSPVGIEFNEYVAIACKFNGQTRYSCGLGLLVIQQGQANQRTKED